jgi:hypothetical protein
MLGWNSVIEDLEHSSVIYSGIGPDLITVLRVTDATTIHGLDFFPPVHTVLQFYISNWDKVDTDPISLTPPDNYHTLEDTFGKKPNESDLLRYFQEMLEKSKKRGYWDVSEMATYDISRCIAIELKRMGVDPRSITISTPQEDTTQLEFKWESKKRTVIYYKGSILDVYDSKFRLPTVDCYYQKSNEGNTKLWNNLILKDLPKYLNKNGVILLGRPFGGKRQRRRQHNRDVQSLGKDFLPLKISAKYAELMKTVSTKQENAIRYGWELYGFRKRF